MTAAKHNLKFPFGVVSKYSWFKTPGKSQKLLLESPAGFGKLRCCKNTAVDIGISDKSVCDDDNSAVFIMNVWVFFCCQLDKKFTETYHLSLQENMKLERAYASLQRKIVDSSR